MGILNAGLTYLDYKAKILKAGKSDDCDAAEREKIILELKQKRYEEIKGIFIGTIATTALFFVPAVMPKSVAGVIVKGVKAIGCTATAVSVFSSLRSLISNKPGVNESGVNESGGDEKPDGNESDGKELDVAQVC